MGFDWSFQTLKNNYTRWFSEIGQWFKDRWDDFAQNTRDLGHKFVGVQDSNSSALSNIWNDVTGKTNTQIQNDAASALQEDAQAHSSAEAEKERQWITDMSNTAHQREVADLQAAGLNPWLSVSSGGSAVQASQIGTAGTSSAQASNVNALASIGTAAAGIGILIKALKAISK